MANTVRIKQASKDLKKPLADKLELEKKAGEGTRHGMPLPLIFPCPSKLHPHFHTALLPFFLRWPQWSSWISEIFLDLHQAPLATPGCGIYVQLFSSNSTEPAVGRHLVGQGDLPMPCAIFLSYLPGLATGAWWDGNGRELPEMAGNTKIWRQTVGVWMSQLW
jgi:hypothetical protein